MAGSVVGAARPASSSRSASFQVQHGRRRGSTRSAEVLPQLSAPAATAGGVAAPSRIRNAPPPPPPARRRQPPRGTLLEQLAQCQANADALISDMQSTFKSRFDRVGLLLQLPARHLHVGRCDSQFSGVARFFADEVVYSFEHPHHRQVEMHMRYADMIGPRLSASERGGVPELCFRIGRELVYFSREYDHTNPAHHLALGFVTRADAKRFGEEVYPQLLAQAKGGEVVPANGSARCGSARLPLTRRSDSFT